MPSRFFTAGRKFSTTTSAFLTIRLKAARPSFDFRLSVIARLLRCRFWKSGPARGPPGGSPPVRAGGISILMTLAPQSASWRTQVGPERTWVRSRTVKRSSAREALGSGIEGTCCGRFYKPGWALWKPPGAADIPRSCGECPQFSRLNIIVLCLRVRNGGTDHDPRSAVLSDPGDDCDIPVTERRTRRGANPHHHG